MSDDDEEVRRTVGTHQHSQPFFLFRLHTEPFYIKDFLFSSLALRVFSDVMIKTRKSQGNRTTVRRGESFSRREVEAAGFDSLSFALG